MNTQTLDSSIAEVKPVTFTPVIVIHGGAGTLNKQSISTEDELRYTQALQEIVQTVQLALRSGVTALDAVSLATVLLEDCPLFNAGKGSVLTANGGFEMDAAIMEGHTLQAGAVCSVSQLKNPILTARKVLEHSPHVLLSQDGAHAFAKTHQQVFVDADYFFTPLRFAQWQRLQNTHSVQLDHHNLSLKNEQNDALASAEGSSTVDPIDPDTKFGTVGAVALDVFGHLAAATSTGGMTNKAVGRVGDTPIIGAGCFANDRCALSATGTGESFMRSVAAFDIHARMKYTQASLAQAMQAVLADDFAKIEGQGGFIGVDAQGNIALEFNTEGMYRAYAIGDQTPICAIYKD